MPITTAAKKALRQSKKRQQRNVRIRNKIKTITRQVDDLVKDGKKQEAEKILQQAYSALDKAVKKKILKKKTVARKKSRLARAVNKSQKGGKKKVVKKKAEKKAKK